jgi:hypothetical protein
MGKLNPTCFGPSYAHPNAKYIMLKLFCTVLMTHFVAVASAQTTTAALDSMLQQDVFAQMLDSLDKQPPKSSVDLSMGLGNRLFSLNNKTLTADQANVNKLIYTPSVAYFHKSGLGFSVTTFLGSDNGQLALFQTGLTPSYDYSGKKISAGISYTRYLLNNSLTVSPSPFQNDLYAYISANKGAVQPGLAIGYASGKFKEYTDSLRIRPAPLPPIRILDTTTYKLSDWSVMASAKHDFLFYELFSKKDGLIITPMLMLVAGTQKYKISSSTVAITRRPQGGALRLRNNSTTVDQTNFALQSAAFSLDLDYGIGKFYLRPQLYLDYYLQETASNRLTATFSCVVGVSF